MPRVLEPAAVQEQVQKVLNAVLLARNALARNAFTEASNAVKSAVRAVYEMQDTLKLKEGVVS